MMKKLNLQSNNSALLYIQILKITVLVIFYVLVSMFSLSAQTPRKDSGADGLHPSELRMGDFVPEDFWNRQHLFYQNGDTIRRDLSAYKGKHVILDFWSLDCGACIASLPHMETLQVEFADTLVILPVNSQRKRNSYERFLNFFKHGTRAMPKPLKLPNIIYDTYFDQLFPIKILPHYVWIKPSGMVKAFISTDFVNREQIATIVEREGAAQ
ncbi:TlpA family protein disulfide reductase [Sphingobacterium sp. InxBP1]|uniref:TlpA family protein disulfide reductase n=1 Tax=Sphingobacterium sp. InxBP1 TaxID=2870328 RepID=UPI00224310C3|nr:TlpA disulfide reductase family protein [Sphingobacterium sp. InxBP1]MCW8313865.1 TlpA family protein disulfide reductase [Sphingobacterium sp. InxBP1]